MTSATVRHLIDRGALAQPHALFLVSPESGETLTYEASRRTARQVAGGLLQGGARPGDTVCVLAENGLTSLQVLLGAMYGGFVPVPINVGGGAVEVAYTVDHCDAEVVVVEETYRPLIEEVRGAVTRPFRVLRAREDVLLSAGPADDETCADPADPALLVYTSGTTGRPKGVVHSHRSLLAGAANVVQAHELTGRDRSLLVLPIHHINATNVTLLPTLLAGGSVVVPRRFNVDRFWSWLVDHGCTWSALVPTLVSQLVDWHAREFPPDLSRIRFLRSSSAPLTPAVQRAFVDRFHVPLLQAMGATEAGNIVSTPLAASSLKTGTVGLPSGCDVKIAGADGRAVPSGESGELLVRGASLMRGYYKDPEGTRAAVDADGWWHSGDIAYRDEDGYVFIIGRSKDLIIKGGVNIAPRQIDEVIESHPAVREAAAVGVADRIFGETIVAFVVLQPGASCGEAELLAYCESRLGPFKTPSRCHVVDDLPKSPSGKVQRRALAALMAESGSRPVWVGASASGAAEAAHDAAPAIDPSAVASVISSAWEAVLGAGRVGPDSNFFLLGGDSLRAIDCLSRLRDRLPVPLSFADFFEHATVAEQAALVRHRMSAEGRVRALEGAPILPRDRSTSAMLSAGQLRLWYLDRLNPQVPVYNEAEAVRLVGSLDADALESALNAVVDRHDLLRATVDDSTEAPRFVVHDRLPVAVARIDLGRMDSSAASAEVDRLLVDEPARLYDLTTRPGLRATLVRVGDREHVFILMLHHLVCDRWSIGALWRELSAFYAAHQQGESLALPPLAIQPGDYAAWQRRQAAALGHADDLAYWRERLRGTPDLLDLPTDRPRPRQSSFAGARRRARLSQAAGGAVLLLSRRQRVSPFVVFATALSVLLSRYSGQSDVSIGVPIADRDQPELRPLIAFLVHTQVLRTQVPRAEPFQRLLAQVQQAVFELRAHRAAPLDQVIAGAGVERTLGHNPLFQVMLTWRDREQQPSIIGLAGCTVEPLLAESRTSKFDLTFFVSDRGDDFFVDVEYSTDLFDAGRIDRMVGHLGQLIESAAAAPETPVGALQMLTEGERRQVLVEWNQTDTDFPADRTLHRLFEGQVEASPDRTAVVCGHERMTYGRLNARANTVARSLVDAGVRSGSLVGVCLDRTSDLASGLLAVLKTGAAYVAIDPAYPAERTSFIVDDAGIDTVLTTTRLAVRVPGRAARLLLVEELGSSESNDQDLEVPVRPDDLAYVLYTSGSTGRPKGVGIRHRSVVNLASWSRARFSDAERAGVLASTSICFDLSVFELLVTLATGGTAILAQNALELHELPARDEVTLVNTVPSVIDELLSRGDLPRSVVTVNLAGEPLDTALVDRVYRQPGVSRVYDLYGPSETTTYSTCALRSPGGRATIGRPIDNTRTYVLDEAGAPVPVGVTGELYIGGVGLARDYWQHHDLTAERFVGDPTGADPGGRLYRTGDLVRYFPDGSLEFLGRRDGQVKVRGYRIELGEIESTLRRHAAVRDAAVVVKGRDPRLRRLVAYVKVAGPLPGAEDFLRGALHASLPEYMVPSAFVLVDALPVLPNGKIDRHALEALDPPAAPARRERTSPATDTERALCDIWSRVLGVEAVGVHDSFFTLGGHSLMLFRILARVHEAFGVEVPLRQMFDLATVEAQAAAIDRLRQVTR
jgi:amino acid adenylation domain-containing protein